MLDSYLGFVSCVVSKVRIQGSCHDSYQGFLDTNCLTSTDRLVPWTRIFHLYHASVDPNPVRLNNIVTVLCRGIFFTFYSVLFYSILVYSILVYSILFYSILFYPILFYSILFYSILSYYTSTFYIT